MTYILAVSSSEDVYFLYSPSSVAVRVYVYDFNLNDYFLFQ